ncbi:hypothetical protein E2542_SST15711 [Spatholobus suberectus]|nr:hypothetical protein E2542_SST15711 [Spatholobus suberectus]
MTMVEVEASNNKCKKSKSTGFSKTWRFRENMKLRSYSDGQNAFVFLNPLGSMSTRSNDAKEKNVVSKKGNGAKCKTSLSPHEKLYMMNRKGKENSKRKSFLPYRQDLIGFFTNVNGFSRNIIPF